MRNMLRLVSILALSALVGGAACGKDKAADKPVEPAPKPKDPPKPKVEPPKPLTAEQKADFIKKCWAAFDAKDEAAVKKCYAKDATWRLVDAVPPMELKGPDAIVEASRPLWAAFPDFKHEVGLVLVNGDDAVAVAAGIGTNSGSFMGAPPTNNKVGIYAARRLQLAPTGETIAEHNWLDQGTMMGQLMPNKDWPARAALEPGVFAQPTVVIAKNDEAEKANLEAAKKLFEAYNKHDVGTVVGMYADDGVYMQLSGAEDYKGKKALEKGIKEWFKASSDARSEEVWTMAAGDYVVAVCKATGTNDGKMGKMKPTGKPFQAEELNILKFENGKVKEHWAFSNGLSYAVQLGLVDPAKLGGGGAAPEGGAKGAEPADKGAEPAEGKKAADKKVEKKADKKAEGDEEGGW